MLDYLNLKLLLTVVLLFCFPETQIWGSTLALTVTPTTYIEDNRRVIQFTCAEKLFSRYELLRWYQIRGTEKKVLNMFQLDYDYTIGRWRDVVLYKTLELSDNGTEIFCAKERIENGVLFVEQKSWKILIKFQKNITPLESNVTIEPTTDDVIIFDEKTELRFTCSGTKPVDGRKYTWHLEGTANDIPSNQRYDAATNINILTLQLNKHHHQNQLFCAQDYQFHFVPGTRTPSLMTYGEQARSKTITLLYKGEGNLTAKPLVKPEKFLDKNNTHIQFTCYAFLQKRELLSWYQMKGSNMILLKMIQLENLKYEKGQWVVLTLKKTLMSFDNGTNLFCSKQSEMSDGNFSKGPESERIPLMFGREVITLETPFITVEPRGKTIYFDVNSTLYFNCSGSKSIDGRNYTWFIRDPDSTLRIPLDQTYDASTNRNSLTLSLNESHHENTLFCAQTYHLYIQHSNGSLLKIYGELVRSNITLVQWEKVKMQRLAMTIAPPLAFVVLLVVAIVVVVRRCRRTVEPSRGEDKEDDVYNYAYEGRVMYANLDLRASPAAYATTLASSESNNYANIVGVCKPTSETCL